jgi:hypothetical protein
VTLTPWVTDVGSTLAAVTVAMGVTLKVAAPAEGAKVLSPE